MLLRQRMTIDSQKRSSRVTASDQATQCQWESAEEWKAAQNICLLPLQYGLRLDKELARQDGLYALSELFQFAASAEGQMLNLLSSRMETRTLLRWRSIFRPISPCVTTESEFYQGAARIASTTPRRDRRHPGAENSARTERVGVLLLADFAYLLQRAETLARECEQGMTTLANNSVLEKSRRSADMAMRVQRLTLIATFFIPSH